MRGSFPRQDHRATCRAVQDEGLILYSCPPPHYQEQPPPTVYDAATPRVGLVRHPGVAVMRGMHETWRLAQREQDVPSFPDADPSFDLDGCCIVPPQASPVRPRGPRLVHKASCDLPVACARGGSTMEACCKIRVRREARWTCRGDHSPAAFVAW